MVDELIQEEMPLEERRKQFYNRVDELAKIIEEEINKLSLDSFCETADFELSRVCVLALGSYFDSKFNQHKGEE